jgi:penicillin-binding protein 2
LKKHIGKEQINLRFNLMTLIIYIIGIILLVQLFNLQIVNGEEYRKQSDTRLTRDSTIKATRGSILDRSGNVLVSSTLSFNLEMYKTKIDNETLNTAILDLVNVLEKNNQSYTDSFPINIEPFEYTLSGTQLENWKTKYSLSSDTTAEEAFYAFKDKYDISNTDVKEIRKIISIRYKITTEGYSSTKAITIAENVSSEVIAEISEQNDKFPGISIVADSSRLYTSGSLASHILGYVGQISDEEYKSNSDDYDKNSLIGKTGIEYMFEKYLKGSNGTKEVEVAVDGTITSETTIEEAVGGSDIVLTIDANLQEVAEEALKENIEKIASGGFGTARDVTGGAVVVMKVDTGEILAMASYPDYDPSAFTDSSKYEERVKYLTGEKGSMFNRAISGSYAPGSVFKMATAIAGLESGAISATEKIRDTGIYDKYNPAAKCWYYTDYGTGHGWLSVSEAIKKSCNYFFYETSDRMGIETLDKYASYFGLGTKTGIELPSETSGTLATPENKAKIGKTNNTETTWGAGDTIRAGIGQSVNAFSPIQIAKYISMLVNNGKTVNPTIVKSIINSDGTQVSKDEIKKYVNEKLGITDDGTEELTISQENLNVVLEGMRSVTEEVGGTAYSVFKDFEIEIGGKTGSAESGTKVNAWFAGFAPYENPEIAVVVLVENGGHGYYTAEVVKKIMQEYFGMNIDNVDESTEAIAYTESIR